MIKGLWDNKYAGEELLYGSDANEYFKEKILGLKPGKILLPGDGEGRNGVFASKNGWDVYSFDGSRVGKEKALKLAYKNNVEIDYRLGSFKDISYQESFFDCMVLTYTHFINHSNNEYTNFLNKYLKKGGLIILEGFSKSHFGKQGGPQNIDMLYSLADIKNDFKDYKILELEEKNTILNEGKGHSGESIVIRLFGEKV